MSTDLHPNPRIEERLRHAFDEIIPKLTEVPTSERSDDDIDGSTWELEVASGPHPRSRVLSLVAAALVVGGGVALWSVSSRPEPTADLSAPPASVGATPTSNTTNSTAVTDGLSTTVSTPTESSALCFDEGCDPVDRLPLVDGAFDLLAGPVSLGTPTIDQALLDQFGIVRCLELTSDGAACQQIEGLAGVSAVSYPDGVEIGTTFTSVSAAEYSSKWNVTGAGAAPLDDVLVRGHAGVRFTYADRTFVVWQERDGVLASVVVPLGSSNDPISIAEGIRTIDGPSTIPYLVVTGLGSPWDASDNDADGVVYVRTGGSLCAGIGFISSPCSTIVARPAPNGSGALQVAAINGPSNAVTARIDLDDGSTQDFTLTSVRGIPETQGFLGTLPNGGDSLTLSWLDAAGTELAAEIIDLGPRPGEVVPTTSPTEAEPTP